MGLVAGSELWAVWTTQKEEGHPDSFHYVPTEPEFIHEVTPDGSCLCGPQRIDVFHVTPFGEEMLPHYRHQALAPEFYGMDDLEIFPD
ncbi:MAG: hypothetical protein CL440_06945 [Acidimicrobiaceae bacterium]|nr:hypothetical protein [Acidimicrobiaceae bacterium]|tara:strand:- start:1341 stop:1604 length:264 start_codon:yes stop_codon:yes gene_type:complete